MGEYGPVNSVPRLLELHDRQFIRVAYQAVLGRSPDQEGEAHYLSLLRGGVHKLAILKRLRQSDEGRAFVPGVAGLDRAIRRHALSALPLIGVLFRMFTGTEGNGPLHRQLRVLTNELGRLRAEQVDCFEVLRELKQPPMAGLHHSLMLSPEPVQPAQMPLVSPELPVTAEGSRRTLDSKEQQLLEILRQSALRSGRAA